VDLESWKEFQKVIINKQRRKGVQQMWREVSACSHHGREWKIVLIWEASTMQGFAIKSPHGWTQDLASAGRIPRCYVPLWQWPARCDNNPGICPDFPFLPALGEGLPRFVLALYHTNPSPRGQLCTVHIQTPTPTVQTPEGKLQQWLALRGKCLIWNERSGMRRCRDYKFKIDLTIVIAPQIRVSLWE
jgi:hypothetical protein